MTQIVCEGCGETFQALLDDQRVCSRRCKKRVFAREYHAARRNDPEYKKKVRLRSKAYYERNTQDPEFREKLRLQSKRNYETNGERRLEREKERRITDPDFARRRREANHKYAGSTAPYIPVGTPLNCERCGAPFLKKGAKQKYCSVRCQNNASRVKNADAHKEQSRNHYHNNKPDVLARRLAQKRAQPWKRLVSSAKIRSVWKILAFDLTNEWAEARWTGCCELTGVRFIVGDRTRSLFSPSLDRIDPKKGYVQGNCRFVLWCVNAFKAEGTDEEMVQVAEAIVRSRDFILSLHREGTTQA